MRWWFVCAGIAVALACLLHWSFRFAYRMELTAYYEDDSYGNNAPWAHANQNYLWSIAARLWLCAVAAVLCVIGVLAARRRGSTAVALPVTAAVIIMLLHLTLTTTWLRWFFD
jgi:hypothetical protein